MVAEPRGGADAETAAMEVNQDGKLVGRGRTIREEEPCGDGFRGVDDHVLGFTG